MNISYILPLYHKADLFRMMLPVNLSFRVPGTEVVLVLDEPSEEQKILDTVRATPGINFKVIVNDWDHAWRPPCIAYNVGARHATAPHLVFADPESAILLPQPDYLVGLVRRDHRLCFGGVCWSYGDFRADDNAEVVSHKIQVCEATTPATLWGYGLFLCPQIAFNRVCGFDESRTHYGYDDTDLRSRITRLGNRCVIDGGIKIFHADHSNDLREHWTKYSPSPNIVLSDQKDAWGYCYNRVAYDWNAKRSI